MTAKSYVDTFRLTYDRTIGLAAMEGRGFSNPVDLAISSIGRIYVLSRTNPLQAYAIRVGVCNLESEYFGDFGGYGTGDGQFVWPTALAFDSDDRLYLADEHTHRISVYDADGRFLHKWGGEGLLSGPAGLAFDAEDNLYVTDHLRHRVLKLDRDGRVLTAWGEQGDTNGQLNLPWGLAVGPDGTVYVADWRNDRVQRFSAEGDFLASYGRSGDGDGEFSRPSGVAVDEEGFIYVADWRNERVQVLDPEGRFVLKLRGQATLSPWAEQFYDANADEKEARAKADLEPKLTDDVDSAHQESARIEKYFWGPCSVKLDKQGRLYVTESYRHRVQVYTRDR